MKSKKVNDVLTEEEVDSLLTAISTGESYKQSKQYAIEQCIKIKNIVNTLQAIDVLEKESSMYLNIEAVNVYKYGEFIEIKNLVSVIEEFLKEVKE